MFRLVLRRVRALFWTARESTPTLSVVVTALFSTALIVVHTRHEFWRDEIHCWGVGRNAAGLLDLLFGNRRYDGHPFLWYYLLYGVSRFSRHPAGLHAVTVALASAAAFLWVRWSQLPRVLRIGCLASYLFFYEYGVMSRSYTLGLFLVVLFLALYPRTALGAVLPSVVLALLAATTVYGMIMSCCLAIPLYTRHLALARSVARGPLFVPTIRSLVVGLVVWLGGLALTVVTSIPPADDMYNSPWRFDFGRADLYTMFAHIWATLFPSQGSGRGWVVGEWLWSNRPALESWLPLLAGGVVGAWALSFSRSWRTLVSFVLGFALMGFFQHAKYLGGMRHWGHYFVFAVVCSSLFRLDTGGRRSGILGDLALAAVLVVQIRAAFWAVRLDLEQPFSGSRETADFIMARGWRDEVFVGSEDNVVTAVTNYLDRPFVAAETGETVRTVTSHNRRHYVSPADLLNLAETTLRTSSNHQIILILNQDPGLLSRPGLQVEPVFTSRPPVIVDEQFRVYRVTPLAP